MSTSSFPIHDITVADFTRRWGAGDFDFVEVGPQDSTGTLIFVRQAGMTPGRGYMTLRLTDAFFSLVRRDTATVSFLANAFNGLLDVTLDPALTGAIGDYLPFCSLASLELLDFAGCAALLTSLSNLRLWASRERIVQSNTDTVDVASFTSGSATDTVDVASFSTSSNDGKVHSHTVDPPQTTSAGHTHPVDPPSTATAGHAHTRNPTGLGVNDITVNWLIIRA